jgi:biopolymer transport protein ExbD
MPMKRKGNSPDDKIPIDMTPMIDIVFQLMTFFVMTLKIVEAEGDFNIKMPLAAPRAGMPDDKQLPPFKLRLKAGTNGNLAEITLNNNTFAPDKAGWDDLRNQIASIVGDERGPGSVQSTAEVELDCDYELKYENVIRAITAVSGYPAQEGGGVVRLIEKIKFSPPRQPR